MKIRDRIKSLRRVKASQLRPNPHNWRTHPKSQRDALRGILSEVGYADALLARELPDGSLELIDGHLRAETTPDQKVPVLVLDVDELVARKLLAILDPMAGLAQPDQAVLGELLDSIDTESAALREMLDNLTKEAGNPLPAPGDAPQDELEIPWGVVIDCDTEEQQCELLEELTGRGLKC